MLNIGTDRSYYTSALTPPVGMVFTEAVATTYSLDLTFLLEAPLHLLSRGFTKETPLEETAILASIKEYSDKITVFVQQGCIHPPRLVKSTILLSMLENMVVEVNAPKDGIFHPKLWLIRFDKPNENDPVFRLVVLSRNMTHDHSWDIALTLEGNTEKRKKKTSNKPLASLLHLLRSLAVRPISVERQNQVDRFAAVVEKIHWVLPKGFLDLKFHLLGTNDPPWKMIPSKKLVVISPFCSNTALQKLAGKVQKRIALVSSKNELQKLSPNTRDLFNHCLHIRSEAEYDDGEGDDSTNQPLESGLHAKVYMFEPENPNNEWRIVLGSANATTKAMITNANIEILVELVGKKLNNRLEQFVDVDSKDGFGSILEPFVPQDENGDVDEEIEKAKDQLRRAKKRFLETRFVLDCQKSEQEDQWSLTLNGSFSPLEGIVEILTWPISVRQVKSGRTLRDDVPKTELGLFHPEEITSFITFKFRTRFDEISDEFVSNIPIRGFPFAEREAAIIRLCISNREGFIQYLLFLLDDPAQGHQTISGGIHLKYWKQWISSDHPPLLEELTRNFGRSPEKLKEVADLIDSLAKSDKSADIIPAGLPELWSVFQSAMGEKNV